MARIIKQNRNNNSSGQNSGQNNSQNSSKNTTPKLSEPTEPNQPVEVSKTSSVQKNTGEVSFANKKPVQKVQKVQIIASPVQKSEPTELSEPPLNSQNFSSNQNCIEVSGHSGVKATICVKEWIEEIVSVDNNGVKKLIKPVFTYTYKGITYNSAKELYKTSKKKIPLKKIKEAESELGEPDVETVPFSAYHDPEVDSIAHEIEKDPIQWFLKRAEWIIGYEKYKKAVLVSAVSAMLPPLPGIRRVHLILEGNPGVGKTSIIKSILRYFPNVIAVTDFSQNALVYMQVDSFDGKIVFVEQLDYAKNYMRESLSEDRICKSVTVTQEDSVPKAVTVCINGQPTWISTIVHNNLSDELLSRLLRISVKEEKENREQVVKAILSRKQLPEVSVKEKIAVMKWLTSLDLTQIPDLSKYEKEIMVMGEYSKRAFELLRNIGIIAYALKSPSLIDELFPYVLYSAVGVSEEELEILKTMDTGIWTTAELSEKVGISQPRLRKMLNSLAERNIVNDDYRDKQHHWSLTSIGRQLVNAFTNTVVEVSNGYIEDLSFWRKHIFEHFGFNAFSPQEFSKTVENMSVEEAEKLLQQLYEAGVVGIIFSNSNTKLYALQGDGFG